MRKLFSLIVIAVAFLCSCSPRIHQSVGAISIISWGGISAEKSDTLYSLAKECGFDMHLGLYRAKESAVASMDAAARNGIDVIISFPQIKDSTESAVALIKDHPALYAYHLKDEPDTSDFYWLADLSDKIGELDPLHPCYINLLPNWAWGVEEYADKIEMFASEFDMPFYSFDNYPVVEEDGVVSVRPDWYRNLEEFSAMSRRHGKSFWGFALAKAHSISDPWPDTVYPEPTLGQLRLQVFSNLLYGAQAIQYFNFTGIVDPVTCGKLPAFELVKQVNSEVRAYSPVFAGCSVQGVWHTGDSIPSGTVMLDGMPHEKVKSLALRQVECPIDERAYTCSVAGPVAQSMGAVVSLIENDDATYLAVQNCSCLETAVLDISFDGFVSLLTSDGLVRFNGQPVVLEPGDVAIFRL